ncbi:putative lipid II flippase FtsW [bacterium]|nr:putative lipid II flippase FtsW [bacterium]
MSDYQPLGKPRRNQRMDGVLLGVILALTLIGVIAVYTAGSERSELLYGSPHHMFLQHIARSLTGLAVLMIAALVPFSTWQRLGWPIVAAALILLVLVFIDPFSVSGKGATRWVRFGPVSFQPSEAAKFALVFFIASYSVKQGDAMKRFVPGVLIPMAVTGSILLMILRQPDFSTAAMIAVIAGMMLFLAGAHFGWLSLTIITFAGAAVGAVLTSPYRRERLLTYLAPHEDTMDAGYQILQSWIGMGRGGLFGVGLGESRQKLFFLPDAHTDFIYSVIGEELGFIGAFLVLVLFGVLVWRGFRIAMNCPDAYGSFLAAGITFAVGLYAVINMAIAAGVLPTTGLPLPLISYGGTSLLITFAALGVVLNISQYSWPKQGARVTGGKR